VNQEKIDVIAPPNDLYIQLLNGLVNINPDSELSYRMDLKVQRGMIDRTLLEQNIEDGIEIKVEIENGSIQKK
jgi:hypothetical protein